MGIADRDYWTRRPQRAAGGAGARLTPVVSWLLMLNVAVFFVDVMFLHNFLAGLRDVKRGWGAFSVDSTLQHGRVWELLTFQFLHGHFPHLLFNMVGLFFFGPWMERWWGSRRFVVFYLLCGVAGAAFYTLLWQLGMFPDEGAGTSLIGASAGIYGILIGVAVIAPDLRVALIFPPIEMSMRQLAMLILAIAVVAVMTGVGGNAGGEAGHLGGALLGYLLIRRPGWLAWAAGTDPEVEIIRPRAFGPRAVPGPQHGVDPQLAAEVDRILEKISQHGIHSLNAGERATLESVSQTRRPPP